MSLFAWMPMHAHAAEDCGEQVQNAIESCDQRMQSANQTKVSGYNAGATDGINKYGTNQMDAGDLMRQKFTDAAKACNEKDFKACKDQCNKALNTAAQKGDRETVSRIEMNFNQCKQKLSDKIARAGEQAAAYGKYADAGAATNNKGCQGDCEIDRKPSYDKNSAQVQNVASKKSAYPLDDPRTIQVIGGDGMEMVQSTTGQYQVIKQMFQGLPPSPYNGGRFIPKVYSQ